MPATQNWLCLINTEFRACVTADQRLPCFSPSGVCAVCLSVSTTVGHHQNKPTMAENAMVLSGHGLSVAEVKAWCSDYAANTALCVQLSFKSERNAVLAGRQETLCGDAVLAELLLENELQVAMSRFTAQFVGSCARRAEIEEYAALASHVSAELRLHLGDSSIKLVLSPSLGGGTGSQLWSGGLLLAEWLKHAHTTNSESFSLVGSSVLELGAGAAALPSIAASQCGAKTVVATDCIGTVVAQMKANLDCNAPTVWARTLEWGAAGRQKYSKDDQFEFILFADAIYNSRGAFLLSLAISALLKPGGVVVGALPNSRIGISNFEDDLSESGFVSTIIAIADTNC